MTVNGIPMKMPITTTIKPSNETSRMFVDQVESSKAHLMLMVKMTHPTCAMQLALEYPCIKSPTMAHCNRLLNLIIKYTHEVGPDRNDSTLWDSTLGVKDDKDKDIEKRFL